MVDWRRKKGATNREKEQTPIPISLVVSLDRCSLARGSDWLFRAANSSDGISTRRDSIFLVSLGAVAGDCLAGGLVIQIA